MADMYFENLPSTNTPVRAENLNKLNDVKVSTTEPSTGEKMWIQFGKNKFDGITEQGNINTNTGEDVYAQSFTRTVNPIRVESNTTYTLNINQQNNQIVVYYYKKNGYLSFEYINTASTYTFTTPNNCEYVRFRFSGLITITNGQLEKGTQATSYEAYVNNKIYIKNTNDIYENFAIDTENQSTSYSTTEQRIGTWTDGKPTYRKVLKIDINSKDANINVNISNLNIKELVDIRGTTYYDTGSYVYRRNLFNTYSYSDTSVSEFSTAYLNNNNLIFRSRNLQLSYAYVVLEYTKTTD